jgi:hypothetical protein
MSHSPGGSEPSRHSRQAYIIIKTIHLMNFANADTLAPINKKMRRSESARTRGVVRFHSADRKNQGSSPKTMPDLETIRQVGRTWLDAGRRPGLLL